MEKYPISNETFGMSMSGFLRAINHIYRSYNCIRVIFALPIVVLSIIMGSIYLAFTHQDPHWINRGGALLAAVAASLAIMEATLERRITEEKLSSASTPKS
ncbi:hypothetical protein [Nitrosococcus oceani]|uniref:hypothetical protein n=1 Tax=Nitrosococcus oceani TaxID=1229 RepID=UPI0011BFAEC6|nr:hypothetical protein [Nitrosococcus oceani]